MASLPTRHATVLKTRRQAKHIPARGIGDIHANGGRVQEPYVARIAKMIEQDV